MKQADHNESLDEALALPTAEAAMLALRTQQVIAHESGVTNTVDPLGGSYFLERLTLDMEEGAYKYFDTIDRLGGMVAAVEQGYPQREIAESSYRFQQAVEKKEKQIVGVNAYVVKPVGFNEFVRALRDLGLFWAVVNRPPPGTVRRESP